MTRPTAISLFSGAGGMDIGIRKAGFNVLYSLELAPFCCLTLRSAVERDKNDTTVIEGDMRGIDPTMFCGKSEKIRGELDLLFGGPPCQPFSLAGKQNGLEDDRGPLLLEIVRFAKSLMPKVILLEQVKGLLSARGRNGEKGGVFHQFLSVLAQIGYESKWKVCCAAEYGVPQMRERVFVVARP